MRQKQVTAGRVAFLARREAIRDELAKGWSMSAVYRQFAPHLPMGLRQFQIYVRRYLVEKVLPPFVPPSAGVQTNAAMPSAASAPPVPAPPPPGEVKAVPPVSAFGLAGAVNPDDLY